MERPRSRPRARAAVVAGGRRGRVGARAHAGRWLRLAQPPAQDDPVHRRGRLARRGARQVLADRVAMKQGLDQVYAYARGSARTYLDDHYRANNPFEIVKTYTVVPA